MKPYANLHGNSGVSEYEVSGNSITIRFKCGKQDYTYSDAVTGRHHVAAMKELALAGRGLSTYIAKRKKELKFT